MVLRIVTWVLGALLAALSGCGGGDPPMPGAEAFVRTAASAGPTAPRDRLTTRLRTALALGPDDNVDATAMLDWAQWKFPALFPAGAANVELDYLGVHYTVRAYPGGNYLGITGEGSIYGLGPFTGQGGLVGFGTIGDYAAQVRSDRCSVYPGSCGEVPRTGTWGGRSADGAVFNFTVDATGVKLVFSELCNGWSSWSRTQGAALGGNGQFSFTVTSSFNEPGVTVSGVVNADGTASGTVARPVSCGPTTRTWTASRRSDRTDVTTPIGELVNPSSTDIALGGAFTATGRLNPSYGSPSGSETYNWSLASKPSDSKLTLPSGPGLRVVPDVQGTYRIAFSVGNGVLDGPSSFVTVRAGAPQAVISGLPPSGFGPMVAGRATVLDGTRSTDAEGDVLSYSWTLIGKPAGSTAAIVDPTSPRASLTPDKVGVFDTYTVQLTVSDGRTSTSTSRFLSVGERNNIAPYANAGVDQETTVGVPITLDGTGSAAIDGATLTYAWTIDQRPAGSTAAVSDATLATARFTPDKDGVYKLKLTVKDGVGWPFGSDATVTVTASTGGNAKPVAGAGIDQAVAVGANVLLSGAASRDANADALRYKWSVVSRPTGSAASLSDATAVAPSFVADRAGPYVLQLIVNDGSVDSLPDVVVVTAR